MIEHFTHQRRKGQEQEDIVHAGPGLQCNTGVPHERDKLRRLETGDPAEGLVRSDQKSKDLFWSALPCLPFHMLAPRPGFAATQYVSTHSTVFCDIAVAIDVLQIPWLCPSISPLQQKPVAVVDEQATSRARQRLAAKTSVNLR
jgi:hypothetical protein